MLVLILVLKDLRRRLADPAALLLNLAIPLVMAGLMALAFGGRGDDRAPVLRLLVVNLDDGPVGRALAGATQNPEAAERLEIRQAKDRDEGLRRLRDEESAALVVLPKDFSKDLLEGRQVTLEILKNPAQSIMPVVAQQGAEVVALYLSVGARLLEGEGVRIEELFKGRGWGDAPAVTALVMVLYERMRSVEPLLFPPLIEVGTKKQDDAEPQSGRLDFMGWLFPGMMMMGLLFTGLTQMRDLLREGVAGTLRRQLTAPLGARRLLFAKIVSVAAVTTLALMLLMLIGRFAFGVRWGAWAPLAVTSALVVLAVTGFAALLYSLVRTERQGDTFGTILVMLMSLLGGTFFPPQSVPSWMQPISRLTISYWGHEALRGLASGGGWERVRVGLPVLAALGAAFTLAGVMMLRRRHLRGAL
jgi:ABC-type multidrug transport system permease subunit